MSYLVWGKINLTDTKSLSRDSEMIFTLIETCANQRFAISFTPNVGVPSDTDFSDKHYYIFTVSDNFLFETCQEFLEPIYYPIDGNPTYEKLNNDLSRLEKLLNKILGYAFVDSVEIFFSDGECDSEDYFPIILHLHEFLEMVYNKYIEAKWIPDIRVCVCR